MGPPVLPDKVAIPTKAKNQNIRVSPAVLYAAGKDGEETLKSLGCSPSRSASVPPQLEMESAFCR
jgi:hypothetical protein